METPHGLFWLLFFGLVAQGCGGSDPEAKVPSDSQKTLSAGQQSESTKERQSADSGIDDGGSDLDIEIDGDGYTITRNAKSVRVRYVEQSRKPEPGYPRVEAKLELETADGWEELVYVYCHDSYDACGSHTEDLSCPVIESSHFTASSLKELYATLDVSVELDLVQELAPFTPIQPCISRLREVTPEFVWYGVIDLEAPEASKETIWNSVQAAEEVWREDAQSGFERVKAAAADLDQSSLSDVERFNVAYRLAMLQRASVDPNPPSPIVNEAGELVKGAGLVIRHIRDARDRLAERDNKEAVPALVSSNWPESELESLPDVVKTALEQEMANVDFDYESTEAIAIHEIRQKETLGYAVQVLYRNPGGDPDDAWLYLLSSGRFMGRIDFSSTNYDGMKWQRAPLKLD